MDLCSERFARSAAKSTYRKLLGLIWHGCELFFLASVGAARANEHENIHGFPPDHIIDEPRKSRQFCSSPGIAGIAVTPWGGRIDMTNTRRLAINKAESNSQINVFPRIGFEDLVFGVSEHCIVLRICLLTVNCRRDK